MSVKFIGLIGLFYDLVYAKILKLTSSESIEK
jgi:hypothetical protein